MMIPYGRQDISEADIQAVVDVLRSDFLTQGPAVPAFERAVSSYCGARHAVAVNSATSALHIACLALGVGSGDRVWTSPNTFVASANCALYCGAEVDFVDIDPHTWNLSVPGLKKKLAQAKKDGCLPKVLVSVHFAGQPAEQEVICQLAHEYGFRVLEDASHAIGASRSGEPVGSCRWSDITVFSFHPVKIITTGEGGMALTNDDEVAWRMANLRSHGITREKARMLGESRGSWYYEQLVLGFNYRMTDMQAALGLSQFARLEEFIERRNALARRYDQLLACMPLQRPEVQRENRSAFHLYVVRLHSNVIRKTHLEVFEAMRDQGIGVNLHYMPVYLQPYYSGLGFRPGLCPEAERYGREAISLPLFFGLNEASQDCVAASLQRALS